MFLAVAKAAGWRDPRSLLGSLDAVVRAYWVLCVLAALVALLPPRRGINWFR
jgi:hypothetical protein